MEETDDTDRSCGMDDGSQGSLSSESAAHLIFAAATAPSPYPQYSTGRISFVTTLSILKPAFNGLKVAGFVEAVKEGKQEGASRAPVVDVWREAGYPYSKAHAERVLQVVVLQGAQSYIVPADQVCSK